MRLLQHPANLAAEHHPLLFANPHVSRGCLVLALCLDFIQAP
jgi:hypothetical protein